MNIIKTAIFASAIASLPAQSSTETVPAAQPSVAGFSLGVKGGTLGFFGAEATYRFNPWISVVGSVNGSQFDVNKSTRNVSMDGKLQLFTTGASLGIHPFKNSFKILLGIFYDGNELKLDDVRLKQDVNVGGVVITPAQVGRAQLNVHYNRVTPYLGVGFDTPFYEGCPLSLTGEVGVLLQFSPKAKIQRNGLNNFPAARNYLEKQAEKSASKPLLKYFPVIAIGIKYGF